MDFGFEKVTNYYLNIEQYKWYSDDLKKYLIKLEQNASCIVGIFAKFWYWGKLTKIQAKQYGIKNKSEDYERWIKLLNKSMNTLEYEYKTDNESNDDFDDNEIVSDCYEPNLSSVPNYILRKLFTFCLYSEENFENWVLEGVSKEKNYPAIDSAKIPLVKESYLAFLYWIARKFENENDIVFEFLPIAEFIQEMSKLKIDSDYKERVHEIRFCEKVLKDWDSIMTNYNDTNEIEPRDFVFLDFFKDKIKLCEDWKYYPKMDSLGNIVNF